MSAPTGEFRPTFGRPRSRVGPEPRSRLDRRCDRVRQVLVVGWLLVIAAALVLGERSASWSTVHRLVQSGEVDAVRVSSELPASATGYGAVAVRWRHGLLRYQARVVQVRGGQPTVNDARSSHDDDASVVPGAPSDRLEALRPWLRVQRDHSPPAGASVFGWWVPDPVGVAAVVLLLTGFALLVAGPTPWRATRWAWFWLLLPPVGGVVFLLFSGPTPGVAAPRDPDRRLRGGWAFLLSLPLAALVGRYRW